jgi:DedD protein
VRDGAAGLRPFHLGLFHLNHRMGLLSFFERGNGAASAGADGGDPVQLARTRARQRLIGAVVLVIVGVIGFPLVFETQPRPIPLDIPIEIPRRDGAPALVMPPARRAAAPAAASGVVAPRDDVVTEAKGDAGKEVPPPAASHPAPAAPVAAAPTAKPTPAPAPAEAPKKTVAEARPAAPVADAARAKALLEGSEPAKEKEAKDGRFVVQVGAFADAASARDTRAKVEKLGLKTYTQVVETASGSRTRVRIGPFASRDEADKALAKTREAGISAVVLSL